MVVNYSVHAWRIVATGLLGLALLVWVPVASSSSEEPPSEEPVAPSEPVDTAPGFELEPVQPVQEEPPVNADVSKGEIDPALQPLIDLVLQDMATRFGLAPTDVEVLQAQSVVWPDGSLGCPTPGMAYIQVQVDGALVRVRVGESVYEYHSGGRRAPFLCKDPMPQPAPTDIPSPPPGGSAAI